MAKQERHIELTGGQAMRWSPDSVLVEHGCTASSQSRSWASRRNQIGDVTENSNRPLMECTPFSQCFQSGELVDKFYPVPEAAIANRDELNSDDGKPGKKADGSCRFGSKQPDTTNIKATENLRRVLPSVGAFTVQCALCLKWRFIPTKEQYEEIRHCILEEPWVCQRASSWRPNASCDEPTDLCQDLTRLWAIDKPNIPRAPPGWERLMVIRGAGSSKFADIYYLEPSGKKLRSMPDVEKFLAEHPEYTKAGINLNQFSFISPRPLDEHYVRKKPSTKIVNVNISHDMEATRPLFKPISAKQRAERLVARRKTLSEILAGGQSQGPEWFQQTNTISSGSVPQGMQMPTDTRTNRTPQIVLEDSLPPGSLAMIPVQLSECLPTSQPSTEKSHQSECMRPSEDGCGL